VIVGPGQGHIAGENQPGGISPFGSSADRKKSAVAARHPIPFVSLNQQGLSLNTSSGT
jgi:hypothetical protein